MRRGGHLVAGIVLGAVLALAVAAVNDAWADVVGGTSSLRGVAVVLVVGGAVVGAGTQARRVPPLTAAAGGASLLALLVVVVARGVDRLPAVIAGHGAALVGSPVGWIVAGMLLGLAAARLRRPSRVAYVWPTARLGDREISHVNPVKVDRK